MCTILSSSFYAPAPWCVFYGTAYGSILQRSIMQQCIGAGGGLADRAGARALLCKLVA